jgi:hypothetical protein
LNIWIGVVVLMDILNWIDILVLMELITGE